MNRTAGARQYEVLLRLLGLGTDSSIAALKRVLGVGQLDAVMVENVEHFFALLGEEGMPLARSEYLPPSQP